MSTSVSPCTKAAAAERGTKARAEQQARDAAGKEANAAYDAAKAEKTAAANAAARADTVGRCRLNLSHPR